MIAGKEEDGIVHHAVGRYNSKYSANSPIHLPDLIFEDAVL